LNENGAEFVEIFLQEASERLQFLREYSGVLLDAYPPIPDVERLYIAAHTLAGTSASYGFPVFSEIASKLAHIFQYAMNATIAAEAADDVAVFKQRYPFAFQSPAVAEDLVIEESENVALAVAADPEVEREQEDSAELVPGYTADIYAMQSVAHVESQASPLAAEPDVMPQDDEVPAEILEFFVPEAEEHLQVVTDCLLSLETNPSDEQIHRLLRAVHTVKGSAAQVGLHRISHVAHRAEDLIGRLRDGQLRPSAEIVDICLEAVDVLKKFLYRQWADETQMQAAVHVLFERIDGVATAKLPDVVPVAEDAPPLRELDAEEERLLAEYAAARALAAANP